MNSIKNAGYEFIHIRESSLVIKVFAEVSYNQKNSLSIAVELLKREDRITAINNREIHSQYFREVLGIDWVEPITSH